MSYGRYDSLMLYMYCEYSPFRRLDYRCNYDAAILLSLPRNNNDGVRDDGDVVNRANAAAD